MAGDDDPDLVRSIALTVPIRLMASILGVPERDIPELRQMSDDLVQGFSINPWRSESDRAEVTFDYGRIGRAITDIHAYFTSLIAERRKEPADDLVTKLSRPDFADSLSENELLWFCLLLLVAGIETTTNLLGNMVLALAGHPEQWQKLKDDRSLIGSAVIESLRFDAPIQNFFRTATHPYVVDGVEIPQGARVMLVFGAANRDPSHYTDPDTFRAERNPTDHVAFGAGIHRCLGAGLAELEGRIVLEQLLDRVDEIEIAGDVVRTTNPTLRGALKLPMRFGER
jgi:cytochrome P450